MPGVTKTTAAAQRDATRVVRASSEIYTVKSQSKTSCNPKLAAEPHGASTYQERATKTEVSRATSPESVRRTEQHHDQITPLLEQSPVRPTKFSHVWMPAKGTNVVVEKKYPPPRSNHFCRAWLINRCFRGPDCFFFHGDIEYYPPVKGIHPPPRYPNTCKLWQIRECFLGFACQFVHEDLEYDIPERPKLSLTASRVRHQASPLGKHQPHKFSEASQDWVRNMCGRGYSCDYVHPDLVHDKPISACSTMSKAVPTALKAPLIDDSVDDPPVGKRPPPRSSDTCIKWLRAKCTSRYACKYRHDDLEYDPPIFHRPVNKSTLSNTGDNNAPAEARAWLHRVHDHAKVKIGPGFEIQELETGFETPWIYLGNIPARVTTEDITDLLRPFGDVVEVRLPSRVNNPSMLVRARFSSPVAAQQASTSLNGMQAFGYKILARLPIHDASRNNAMFQDTSVRIRWEAPSKVGYCGYATMEHANEALAVTRKPFRDHFVHGSIHVGLPVVGLVTVRFRGLPLDVTKEDMIWFAKPDDVVWARPNYQNLHYATNRIKSILQENTELAGFVVQPPPYRSGAIVQAWAHFTTPTDAKAASSRLHGRKPLFTGKTKIFAQHVQSLTFSVASATYDKLCSDIEALSRTIYRVRRTEMSIIHRRAPMTTLLKLTGEDLKELGQLKVELEKILNWETVRHGPNIAWDPFFAHPSGMSFLEGLEREVPAVIIRPDSYRRMIRLLGCSEPRSYVRNRILAKLDELRAQQIRFIPLDGWLLGLFMSKNLMQVQDQIGRENVSLDLRNRGLVIRGSDAAYEIAREAVTRARRTQLHPGRRRTFAQCPVCFDEVTNSVTLPCSHSWCRDCISRYLTSSIDNKYFPLTCLGNDAKCTEQIPLQVARKILTTREFDAIVDAAFASHIQSRADEFHYCPSPDCPQIYRRAPRDTVLQCPSCLLRICPNCHVEAHDGFACPDPEADNNLFKKWMQKHDVKPCPGCKVLIERAEGCNHMTCTQCKTHICWVCLQTFPKGDGIYDHMRSAHGGIGLGAD
ncbi:hypothetical protein D9615_006139 [Tricholomella constricta]|uniref:RBR-type E3 ubiquitin transferase n=1 Tax=Tricholomella constricta TaxID=117010 RepID=A0A8H5HBC1_9AGAR|nr:hypothetical protein D9615_006139 [Tricholomella constricta]